MQHFIVKFISSLSGTFGNSIRDFCWWLTTEWWGYAREVLNVKFWLHLIYIGLIRVNINLYHSHHFCPKCLFVRIISKGFQMLFLLLSHRLKKKSIQPC